MANRFPLIIDIDDSKIKELSANDNLDLTGNEISAVQSIFPEATETYDLGSNSLRWRDLYLSGSSIYLGNTQITEAEWLDVTGNVNVLGTMAFQNSDNVSITGGTIDATFAYSNVSSDLLSTNLNDVIDELNTKTIDLSNNAYSNAVSYINTEIGNLINSAPGVLDTLNELAEAIGDDDNFFITVNNNINTAYSNAVADATNLAGNAYSNAVAYVDAELSALINSAPGVLDTLNELAAAIGDDDNFFITVNNNINTAYSNAVADATNLAGNAYSNAVAYVDSQTTDTIEEGNTNLYYLDSRVDSHLSAANGISYNTGSITADQDISPAANVTFTKVTGLSLPISGSDAASKTYVDEIAEGLKAKPAVEVISLSNLSATYDNANSGVGATLTSLTNTAFPTIDGVTLTSTTPGENGILVAGQTNSAHNGRYNLIQVGDGSNPWILERCALCDEADEIPGTFIFIKNGNTYAGTGWVQVVDDPLTFTVGTDDIDVIQFSQAGVYTANAGLILDGLDFRVDANIAGAYLSYSSGILNVQVNSTNSSNTIVVRTADGSFSANVITATSFSGDGTSVTNVNAATVGSNTAIDLRAYSNAAADEAYSNATSYADTIAGTAYSNATSYADSVAGTAYANAVSYTDAEISALIDTAPALLDTLNELAAAINDDPDFANSVTNQITTAYSNATSYADSVAGTAYANAVSQIGNGTLTLATSGIATGSQTFTANQNSSATFTVNVPATNLTTTANATIRTVLSSTGTNVILPAANTTEAGVMTSADRTTLNGLGTMSTQNSDSVSITGGTIDANVVYSNTATTLVSNNVQDAIDEVSDKHDALNQTQGSISIASANTVETVSSFAISSFRTGKYVVSVYANTDVYASEIIVTHDGTNVYITEYGVLASDEYMTFSADIDSGNLRLRAQSTIPNANVDFTRTLVVV